MDVQIQSSVTLVYVHIQNTHKKHLETILNRLELEIVRCAAPYICPVIKMDSIVFVLL